MLTQRADHDANFTRRDLVALIIASVLLIVTLTATLAIDVCPSGLGLTGGATRESVRAPRAIDLRERHLQKRATDPAAEGVPPQYDYSPERARAVAAQQGAAFSQSVARADAAFNRPRVRSTGRPCSEHPVPV